MIIWADDRNMQGGHNDADVWSEVVSLGPPTATLAIMKTQPVGVLAVGETITYTISVTNSGGLTATNVVVTDTLNGNPVVVAGLDTIEPWGSAVYTFSYTIQAADCDSGLSNIAAVFSQETGQITMAGPILTAIDCTKYLYMPVVLRGS